MRLLPGWRVEIHRAVLGRRRTSREAGNQDGRDCSVCCHVPTAPLSERKLRRVFSAYWGMRAAVIIQAVAAPHVETTHASPILLSVTGVAPNPISPLGPFVCRCCDAIRSCGSVGCAAARASFTHAARNASRRCVQFDQDDRWVRLSLAIGTPCNFRVAFHTGEHLHFVAMLTSKPRFSGTRARRMGGAGRC